MCVSDNERRREESVRKMTSAIAGILGGAAPSVYLYGSCVLRDFRLGWSDIDILVLTEKQITEEQAARLVPLRQTMLAREPDDPYYRSFEGGMLTLGAFLDGSPDRVVYWGTSGERVADNYRFDSFCMYELLHFGRLLCGADVRAALKPPAYSDLRRDVRRHFESIRLYGSSTGHSLYTFGWLLDIARGIYTLRTGEVLPKTLAGERALEDGISPVPETLALALRVRRDPALFSRENIAARADTLGPDIQRFADVLEEELRRADARSDI